jgi:hypothetical protein
MSCKLILQGSCHYNAHVGYIDIEIYLEGLGLKILT